MLHLSSQSHLHGVGFFLEIKAASQRENHFLRFDQEVEMLSGGLAVSQKLILF
jgi:hypothetical protein